MLDEPSLLKILLGTHWLGMLLALGTAAIADTLGLRILLFKARGPRRAVFTWLHHLIGLALFLLLFSGGALIALRFGSWCELDRAIVMQLGPVCVPNKVIAKLILISALLCVALLMDAHVLPLSKRSERPLLAVLPLPDVIRAGLIGSASLTCWVSLAAIPLVKELHRWQVTELLTAAAAIWLSLATGMVLMLVGVRYRMRLSGDISVADRPTTTGRRAGTAHAGALLAATQPAKVNAAGFNASPATAHHHRARTVDIFKPITLETAFAACRQAVFGTAALSFVINLLMLTGPLYMLQVYDRVLTSRSLETLTVLTGLLIGLYAFLGALDLIRTRILSRVALRLDRLLGPSLLAGAIGASAGGQTQQPLRDLEQIRHFVSGPAPSAVFDLPWSPLFVALIFLLHPMLGIVALAGTLVLIVLSITNQLLTRAPLARATEDLARTHAIVEAGRRGAETLRAMGMAEAHRARWLGEHRAALTRQLHAGDIASGFAVTIKIGRLLLQSLILGTGAYLAINDAMSPGAMIAASIIATRGLAPVEQLIAQWRGIITTSGAVKRCRTALSTPPSTEQCLALPEPRGELDVAKLYVAAPGRTDPVLKGLSFRLQPGDAVAVIGPSACGKSTLARALVGVWPARHGEIRLDGAELCQWDPEKLGCHIGYLPQDVVLFDGTIVENIARLESSPDPRAVLAAATAAGVHEMILRLDDGYGTRVGEGGVALSGGQRQRIALARALYGNPALIVMDEPNANLDRDGEAALVAAIKRAREAGSTVVVMAHRQSVLAAVNQVLVLNDGRQVAFGPPGKILRKPRAQNDTEPRNGNSASVKIATNAG